MTEASDHPESRLSSVGTGSGEVIRSAYGSDPNQFGDLRLPVGAGPHPVVILIHGGFWRARFGLDLMDGLGEDLAGRGIASWNLEYRRVGQAGGGWPGTLGDVAQAADHLAGLAARYGLDLTRVVALGHSAGGQLALWLAARRRLPVDALPDGTPAFAEVKAGASLTCPVAGAISLAGVVDLAEAWRRNLGAGAVAELLGGGPAEAPARYAVASPIALLPIGVPQVLIHGTADDRVPVELSRTYAAAALAAGDDARLRELSGVDHFAVIDPASPAWAIIVEELTALLTPPAHEPRPAS